MDDRSTASEKLMHIENQKLKLNESGFTLIEFIVAFAILMIVLVGIHSLVFVDLLSFRLSRQQSIVKNIAESELNRLKTLAFNDTDLDTSSPHTSNQVTPRGVKVTIEWTVTEETSGSERVKVKRIDLVPYVSSHPIKSKVFVARVYYYAYEQSES